jgi:hypothetical protein
VGAQRSGYPASKGVCREVVAKFAVGLNFAIVVGRANALEAWWRQDFDAGATRGDWLEARDGLDNFVTFGIVCTS